MATHGYIKIIKSDKTESVVHAFHDGYESNMLVDIFNIPIWIYNYLKNDKRNSYKYDLFAGKDDKKYNQDFSKMVDMWNSMIPLDSTDYTFESFMIAADPLMYGVGFEKNCDILVDFSKGKNKRLPYCEVNLKIEEEEYIEEYDEIVKKINLLIYHDELKIVKKFDSETNKLSYLMNIDLIVADLIWQDISDSVKRDKKINSVLD